MNRFLVAGLFLANFLHAQSENSPLHNWGLNFQVNANSTVFTQSADRRDPRFQTSSFLSPGFGLFIKPYSGQWIEFIANAGYRKRGSGSIIYVPVPNNQLVLIDIDERFQCLDGDIQLRVKMNRPRINPFAGVGGGFNYVLKRKNGVGNNIQVEDPIYLPVQTIIPAEGYNPFTAKFVACAGISINNVADFEFSAHIDQQPVIKNEYLNMWLWTSSFTIRINLPELYRLEKTKK
ncbi:MAG: hypothetical protein IM638_15600 [Bacteroidetes bacterium]|nr:hypothetical protein [Bacteroidota bacterium]